MNTKHLLNSVVACVFVLLPVIHPQFAVAADADVVEKRIELKVLYAGKPDSERMKDFASFLEKHFAKVSTSNYEAFTPEDANGFDAVILDWPSIYHRDANGKVVWDNKSILVQPKPPQLDKSYARPTVLIGSVAGTIGNQQQLAINWKCLCLENFAHDVVQSHPIFHEPLAVDLQFTEQEKPLDYFLYPGTEKLGESLRAWKVQEKNFPEIDPGLVSSRESFTETPDAEVISGGFNGKGPTSVAIGRHGNYLQWGFSADPTDMTASARAAFVNAICYIYRFDGKTHGPTTSRFNSRENFLVKIYYLRSVSDTYVVKQAAELKQNLRENPPPAEQLKAIGDDPEAYVRNMYSSFAKQTLDSIPKDVRDQCHDNTEQLIRYYKDNLEYLRVETKGAQSYFVDEDVQKLGVSNRKTELLEKCIDMLEKQSDPELAKKLLERYTTQHWATAAEWRTWLGKERNMLRFNEELGRFASASPNSTVN
jgi:hypothetical protein